MSTERQRHIEHRIAEVLKAGVNTKEYDLVHAEQSAVMMKRNARLSEIIHQLPENLRKAVMLVLLQETSLLLCTFILEATFAVHEPAMKVAAARRDDAQLDAIERSIQQMMTV